MASVLAWVADSVYCHFGSPKRRASSSETMIASSFGSRNWLPRAIRSLTARTKRFRRVAAEHRQVGDVEVVIGVPVDVREPGAVAFRDPRRLVVIAAHHPGHRDAVGHRCTRTLTQRVRPRVLVAESGVLGVLELADERVIDGRLDRGRGGHGGDDIGLDGPATD